MCNSEPKTTLSVRLAVRTTFAAPFRQRGRFFIEERGEYRQAAGAVRPKINYATCVFRLPRLLTAKPPVKDQTDGSACTSIPGQRGGKLPTPCWQDKGVLDRRQKHTLRPVALKRPFCGYVRQKTKRPPVLSAYFASRAGFSLRGSARCPVTML